MKKILENLQEAERTIRIADHLLYVTFPLVQDKKLLLKILAEINKAVMKNITSILQYEYLFKRITLFSDPKSNLRTFKEKCAPNYQISEDEIKILEELFDLAKKHKQSPMEFVRNEKVVILTNGNPDILTLEKVKEFLVLAKNILRNTKIKIQSY